MKVFNTLLLTGTALLAGQVHAQDDGAIVGGQNVGSNSDYPWMVSLQRSSGFHFCGGSLIAPNVVMTAAHCMGSSSFQAVVKGDKGLRTSSGTAYGVKKVYVHEQYSSSTQNNDIALVELTSSVTDVAPVAWDQTNNDWVNTNTMAIGWGTLSSGGSSPTILQEVVVPVRSNSECSQGYPNKITNAMVCAGYPQGGRDSCQGDSGGPLFIPGSSETVVGVVSWGYGCAQAGKLGVYARVANLKGWVQGKLDIINGGGGGNPGTCQDSPSGWYDSDGPTYTCDWYSVGSRCAQYGNAYENQGKTANEACCACGGGVQESIGQVSIPASAKTDVADCECMNLGVGAFDKCTDVAGTGYCLINEPGIATPKCKAPAGSTLKFSNNYSNYYLAGCTPSPRLPTDEVIAAAPLESTATTPDATQQAPPATVDNTPMVVAGVMGAVAGVAMITAGVAVVQLKKAKTADDFSEFRVQNQA